MEEYTTYIFEKSKAKRRKRLFYNLGIVAAIVGIIYMFLIGIMGIGLTITGSIALIIAIIKMKDYDDKYMGISAYGNRGTKFKITETGFTLGESELPFSELTDLVIYVDEYAGMSREIFGVHHGGNNEITFKHKNQPYKINYIIKNKGDFKKVEKLVAKIESKN